MTLPLITIGITCYNAADTIERAINSAMAQNWPNFEIVVTDDCSQDASLSILRTLAEKSNGKIRLFLSETNGGVAKSRNRLIEEARGEYLAFFDDDDESRMDRLTIQYERIAAYAQNHPNKILCCYGSICKKYPNGYETHLPAIGSKEKIPQGSDMVAYQLFLDRDPDVFYGAGTPSCALMIETAALKKAGGYDIEMKRNEDSELSVRLGHMGAHFIGCAEEIVIQYASDGGDKKPEIGYQSEKALIQKYREILERHGRYDFALGWTKVRFFHYAQRRYRAIAEIIWLALRHPILTISRFAKAAPQRLSHERKMAK